MIELAPGANQVAIRDALVQSKDVYLQPGIFPCTAALRIPSGGVHLWGPGTIKLTAAGPGYDALISENYPSSGGSDGAVIEQITVDGNRLIMTGDTSSCVFFGSQDLRFQNVTIKNMAGTGLLFRSVKRAKVLSPTLLDCLIDGFCAYDDSASVQVRDGYGKGHGGYAFLLMGAEAPGQHQIVDCSIQGCEAEQNAQGFGASSSVYRSVIQGNIAHHNVINIYLAGSLLDVEHNVNDVLVEGNVLSFAGSRNIKVGGPTGFVDYARIIANPCQDAPVDVELTARARSTYGRSNPLRGGGLLNNGIGTDWL